MYMESRDEAAKHAVQWWLRTVAVAVVPPDRLAATEPPQSVQEFTS
jgi:hypothetical protein